MQSPEAARWREAAEAEYNSLVSHDTFKLVEHPPGVKVLGSRWVFKTKRHTDGTVARYKGRIVVQGFRQTVTAGEDYNIDELAAPVAAMNSVRLTVATAAYNDWDCLQCDVDTAYLYSAVSEDIYVEQPHGFEVRGPNGEILVWKLQRSLYGLKQSAYNWNNTISSYFSELGFTASPADYCVFVRATNDNDIVIIALYVDDLVITGANRDSLEAVKARIGTRFKIKDLGDVHHLLGMRVTRDRQQGMVKLDQEHFIIEMLERFDMATCNKVRSPALPGDTVTKESCPTSTEEIAVMKEVPYRSLVGSLMYAAHVTRPDIANTVRGLGTVAHNPGEEHWLKAKRCLRYLSGTKELGLVYWRKDRLEEQQLLLTGYVDADWAGDSHSGRSTSGCLFMVAGGAVAFASRLQKSVARSTMEAEYMALFEAAQMAIILRDLLQHMRQPQLEPTIIFEDNTACIALANSQGYTKRSRHVNIKYHFTREQVQSGIITVQQIGTKEQLADGLTKNVSPARLEELRDVIMG